MILCNSGSTQRNLFTLQPKSWKSERVGKDQTRILMVCKKPNQVLEVREFFYFVMCGNAVLVSGDLGINF